MHGRSRYCRGTTYYAALIITIIAAGAAAYVGITREHVNLPSIPATPTPFAASPTPHGMTATPIPTPTPAPAPPASPSVIPETPEANATPALAPATAGDIGSLEVATDKQEYYPQETLNVAVRVNASRDLPPCYVTLQGVTSMFGHDYVYESERVALVAGENAFNYSFQLPSCSACSGLAYGEHNFTVRISFNGEPLKNASAAIRVVSPG